jgi:hypothetical protein
MFKFRHGETVALKEDHPLIDLKAGDTGTVIVCYDMDPPAYDVTFRGPDGKEFDCLMYESELEAVTQPG